MISLYHKTLLSEKDGHAEGRVLLKRALSDRGTDYEAEQKYKNEYGKEYFYSNALYYNVSHTKTLVCAAVSDSEVGVDCETLRAFDDHLKIAMRFFTENEYLKIKDAADPLREFFAVWTKKESYVKYTGKGFTVPFSSFDVYSLDTEQKTFEINGCFVTVTGDGAAGTIIINGDTI